MAVGAAWPGPMYGKWTIGVTTAPLEPGTSIPRTDLYPINTGFFASLRIPVLLGRTFTAADDDDKAPGVAIVSVSMARRLFGDENPLGKTLKLGGPSNLVGHAFAETPTQTIVGVVGDVRTRGFLQESPGQVYVPLARRPQRTLMFYVKSGQPVASAIRAEVAKLDPALALADVRPMAEIAGRTLGTQRFATVLFGVFAGVALLLCAIGVYGLVSFSVAQRTREIGIRVALGASRRSVVRLVVTRLAVVVGCGVVAGLVGALALTRAIAALLQGMSPLDVATFAAVPLVLLAVAGIACLAPVRRALGVDPMTALRDA
jgi:putative ABC transport system permease protein